MATQAVFEVQSPHTLSSDPSSETSMSAEHHTADDLESTEQQRPAQPAPLNLPGYEVLVWRNVTGQKFRIPENDRPRLDSWVWKQKHGWRVWGSVGEEYWLCKICHGRRSSKKHWFKSFKSTTRAGDHMKSEHRISAEGEIPRSPEHYKKRKLDHYLKGYDAATAVENSALAGFKLLEFRALLLQWIIADNIDSERSSLPTCDGSLATPTRGLRCRRTPRY